MQNFEKLEYYLSLNIQKTDDRKNDFEEVLVGGLNDNIAYVNNNPLHIRINRLFSEQVNFDTKIMDNDPFKIQYIHRIYATPFYVSYLSNQRLAVKIIDFYDWQPQITLYRIIVVKRIDYTRKHTFKLVADIDDFIKKNQNEIIVNEIPIKFSENISIDSQNIEAQLTNDYEICTITIGFEKANLSTITLDLLIKKLYKLCEHSRKEHISKYFVTKNLTAEKKLDELWFRQKYILPDFQIDPGINLENGEAGEELFWIKDLFTYFNTKNNLSKQDAITFEGNENKSSYIYEKFASKKELIQLLLNADTENEETYKTVQDWWHFYSFPLTEQQLAKIYENSASEIFAIYFLSIQFNMSISEIIYNKINTFSQSNGKTSLHHFLFLLAYLYCRISKINNESIRFIPGYYWDNNYKALYDIKNNIKIEQAKFSRDIQTKIKTDEISFLINKNCKLFLEDQNKTLKIYPLHSLIGKFNNHATEIKLDDFCIRLPLIWENGIIEFNYLKIKWILKKNRFQFTVHSAQKTNLLIDKQNIELDKGNKVIVYVEAQKMQPKIIANLTNDFGCLLFSKRRQGGFPAIIEAISLTRYGTITQNLLYSTKSKKHKLFGVNSGQQYQRIEINSEATNIDLFAKHCQTSLSIQHIRNDFIDRLLFLDIKQKNKILLYIDVHFIYGINLIDNFFEKNFGFFPDFIIRESKNKIQTKSNLIIEFKYMLENTATTAIEQQAGNHLILKGQSIEVLLFSLKELILKSVKILNYNAS